MRAPFVDPLSGLELLNKALPLVGREMEMQVISSILDTVAHARPSGARSLIVSGDVGMGKSRLLEEMCLAAERQDFLVMKGSAYESGGMFPYLPFIEAFRPIIRATSKENLRRYTGLDASQGENLAASTPEIISLTGSPLITAFSQLFPELAQRLQVTLSQEILSPDQEKFRLFDAIATLLERMARERPVLLCIDNLQWADSASLELTMYLTVRLHGSQVALVGATRPPQAPSPAADSADGTGVSTPTAAANAMRILRELMLQGMLLLIPLGPLNEQACETHLHALLPGELPETLAQSLLARAGGNPFFLEELVRALCLNERLILRNGAWKLMGSLQARDLPERVTLAVGQRLQGLRCRELLQVAALIGRIFPLQVLAQVLEISEERAQEALEEALQAALVARISPDLSDWYDVDEDTEASSHTSVLRFCQGIVQEVLAEEVQPQRRRQLHGLIGKALEAYYGAAASVHAAELARQYVLSDRREEALIWGMLASEDAMRQQAYREVINHLSTVLKLLKAGVRFPEDRAAPTLSQLYLALGESRLKLGELEPASSAFHQALEQARTLAEQQGAGEPLVLARANRMLADAYRLQGKYELALAHLQAATYLLGNDTGEFEPEYTAEQQSTAMPISWLHSGRYALLPARSNGLGTRVSFSQLQTNERLLLLQASAMLNLLLFRIDEAEKEFWQLHQLAAEIGDRGSQAFALHNLGWLRGWGEHIGETLRLIHQARELYIAMGDPFHAALGDQSLGIIYQALGEMDKARQYNEQGIERARRYGIQHILGWLHCNQGIMDLAQGNWTESEEHFHRAVEEGEKLGNARIKPLALQSQAILHFRRGNWQASEQTFQEAIQSAINTEWYPGTLALYGHFLAVTGCVAAARVQLDRAADQTEPPGYSGDFYIPFLAEGYLHLGDYERASFYTERINSLRDFSYYGISVGRILGEVAALQGKWQVAEQSFEHGLALCQRSSNTPEEATILYEQARTALMRAGSNAGSASPDSHVHELCNRARELFQHYGMQRSIDLIDTLQEGMRQLEERPHVYDISPAAASPHLLHADYQLDLHLTRRELEVLRLVAEGRTDREVADILVLSPRTVNRHLSNIFVKLDVPGRAAAVAFAIRQGLVD
ncbi:MAG TPA: AAA family ATPase [Ktedonobacteraceae bacterium]|nr:AAA family ATPase [Ktedonobacteraceae bacterium]